MIQWSKLFRKHQFRYTRSSIPLANRQEVLSNCFDHLSVLYIEEVLLTEYCERESALLYAIPRGRNLLLCISW